MKRIVFALLVVLVLAVSVAVVLASHNGAVVTYEVGECGQTTVRATIADPAGTHKVSNMSLVVSANGNTQFVTVPVDGSSVQLVAGPFFDNPTVYYRVAGGSERDYDDPSWDGYGQTGFGTNVAAYAASVGGYGWTLSGPNDPNPFTNWYEVQVTGCPLTKDQCKDGGWEALGFRNQGLCIQYVNQQQHDD